MTDRTDRRQFETQKRLGKERPTKAITTNAAAEAKSRGNVAAFRENVSLSSFILVVLLIGNAAGGLRLLPYCSQITRGM